MTYPVDDGLWPGDDVYPFGSSEEREATYSVSLVSRVPKETGGPTLAEVDRLVFEELTYVDELNRPGSASLRCPVGTLSTAAKARLVDLASNPSEVWVFRDSDLVWAGGIDTVSVQDRNVQLECSGLLGYLWRMGLITDLVFQQIDQFSIVASLVNHHQSLLYGHYGIDTAFVGTSGVKLDRDWSRDELHGVGDLVTELAASKTGFDFHVDAGTRDLVLSHPRRGRDLTSTVVLDERNIDSASVSISVTPEDMITDLSATATWADSVGTNSTVYLARANTGLRSSFGRVWGSQTFSVPQSEEMEDHADAYLEERDRPLFQPGVTIVPRVGSDTTDFGVGDTVQYSYDAGLGLQTGSYRVAKMSVQTQASGARRISVDFA